MYKIEYVQDIDTRALSKLSKKDINAIEQAIEQKIAKHPDHFGKPLRKSLKGYWSLRVGDYRVAYRIEKNVVKIFAIEHRSVIYKKLEKRLRSG